MRHPAARIGLVVLILTVAAVADASHGGWRTISWIPITVIFVVVVVTIIIGERRRP